MATTQGENAMPSQDGLWVNGERFTLDDLTYREQREMRTITAQLAPDGDVEAASEIDLIPAMVTVIRRRTEPDFTVEQALELKPTQLVPEQRPTKQRGKAK